MTGNSTPESSWVPLPLEVYQPVLSSGNRVPRTPCRKTSSPRAGLGEPQAPAGPTILAAGASMGADSPEGPSGRLDKTRGDSTPARTGVPSTRTPTSPGSPTVPT